ncbi:uncharacterized protein LOC135153559 [Lytechinus pictus]|uniref:uncharacterized protein LOC135153559 n=1 Tax=Lytechinus pictus TaxID=7653 RepID=UPI0030B9FF14
MVNSNATMANVTNAKKSKGSGKSRDVHRGNFSAYQRELDSIIKDLKDTNDPKPNKNPVRNKAASEACVKQRYKSSKTPEAKPRRKHGSENAKLKPTLNPVQLEKLESTAFAALQVIQNTVVSIDKLQEEDIYKEGDESVVAENTTCESWYGVEKWQKGTFHSNYQVSRALESKRRNTVEDSKTNPQIPDQRGITAIGLGDLKPFKNGKSTEQHKTFKHGKRGEEIFQNGQRKGVDDNLNIQEMPNKMNDHINTGGIAAEPQLQSTTVSTQPISHTERGNLVAEARSNARLKTNQSNFQKSIASSSLRSSGKQMISTRTPIDGDTGRSNPKQSGSNTIHNQQLIESSTQTDVNRAELDASTDITYPDQTYLPRGLLGRETEGSKVSVASDGNELQRGNAESYLSRMNDGDGQKDLQEELDKLKEGNEDLERQLRETIDFEVQAMKAYIRLVKQHRQLKRKLQGMFFLCPRG